MWAICEIGGKQILVKEGQKLVIERIKNKNEGDGFEIDKVLLLVDEKSGKIEVGQPFLSSVKVLGKILKEKKGPKITVFKYKRRKGYHKKQGYRSLLNEISIEKIIKSSRSG